METAIPGILNKIENNQLTAALQECTELLSVDNNNADVQHLSGIIYAQLGQLTQSINAIKTAIRLDPYNAQYHSNISNAYKKLGNMELQF